MKTLSFFILILCQSMVIDENTLGTSLSELFLGNKPIEIRESNYKDYRFPNYEYCSGEELVGMYNFYGFKIDRFAVKMNAEQRVREIVVVIKTYEPQLFYETINKWFGTPSTGSLSKFYIEKHGFQIPTQIDRDSLDSYYERLPKPSLDEFSELKNLAWYDINKSNLSSNSSIDLIIKNKTNPNLEFHTKEIWVILKECKD